MALILALCRFFGRMLHNSETVLLITFCDIRSANSFQTPGTVIYFGITNPAVFHKQLNFVADFVKFTHWLFVYLGKGHPSCTECLRGRYSVLRKLLKHSKIELWNLRVWWTVWMSTKYSLQRIAQFSWHMRQWWDFLRCSSTRKRANIIASHGRTNVRANGNPVSPPPQLKLVL